MLALALAGGLLVGAVLGALGAGGSILAVPILVYLLGQEPYAATTGSLLVVGTSALAGVAAYARAGRVRWKTGAVFGLLGIAGSVTGSRLSAAVPPDVLLASFAALMVVAAAAMLLRRAAATAEAGANADPAVHWRPGRMIAAATAVGLLTGFFGIGGGFLVIPALVVVLRLRMPDAVGTSLLVIAVNAMVALAARGPAAGLDWRMLAVFTSAAVGGGLLAARVAVRVQPQRLAAAFSLLLIAVAAYTGVHSLPHLL